MEDLDRWLSDGHTANIDAFPFEVDLPKARLVAERRGQAIAAAREMFRLFNLEVEPRVLEDIQSQLRRT